MITFCNVSKYYNNCLALRNINVNVCNGEFVFLVGKSGSGKSTFIKLIIKEELPSDGALYVTGYNTKRILDKKVSQFRQNIGVIFQDFRLLKNKNVFQNVAFSMQVIGKDNMFISYNAKRVLRIVGLKNKSKNMPYQLSGGEQQRVSMARAIANDPKILLADEPTGNLDFHTSIEIMKIIDKINKNGTTVIMATHNQSIVRKMNKRVIYIDSGKIIKDEFRGDVF